MAIIVHLVAFLVIAAGLTLAFLAPTEGMGVRDVFFARLLIAAPAVGLGLIIWAIGVAVGVLKRIEDQGETLSQQLLALRAAAPPAPLADGPIVAMPPPLVEMPAPPAPPKPVGPSATVMAGGTALAAGAAGLAAAASARDQPRDPGAESARVEPPALELPVLDSPDSKPPAEVSPPPKLDTPAPPALGGVAPMAPPPPIGVPSEVSEDDALSAQVAAAIEAVNARPELRPPLFPNVDAPTMGTTSASLLTDLAPPTDEDRAARLGRNFLEEALFADDTETPVDDAAGVPEPANVEETHEAPTSEAAAEGDSAHAAEASLEDDAPAAPEPAPLIAPEPVIAIAQTLVTIPAPTVEPEAPQPEVEPVRPMAEPPSVAANTAIGRAPTVAEFMERGADAIEAEEAPRRVIREGQFAGRRYRMFDNGSLEIDTEQSTIRFATLDEFRAFVAAASKRGPSEDRVGA